MKKQFFTLTIFLSFIFYSNVFLGQVELRVDGILVESGSPTVIGKFNPGVASQGTISGIYDNNAMLNIISVTGTTAGIHMQREGRKQNVKMSITGEHGQFGLLFQIRTEEDAYLQPLKLIETGQVLVGSNAEIQNFSSYGDVKLFVDGAILAEELRVETGWADYVFEKDYPLASLSSVESFIKENGHLPAIPSAAEIESKGLHVGSMTVMQQEKIEELFLYMIDLKKEMETLSKENQQLKQDLKSLQAKQ